MNGYQTGMSNERKGSVLFLGNRCRIFWAIQEQALLEAQCGIYLFDSFCYVCICLSAISLNLILFRPYSIYFSGSEMFESRKIRSLFFLTWSYRCWQLNVFRHFSFSARFSIICDIMFTVCFTYHRLLYYLRIKIKSLWNWMFVSILKWFQNVCKNIRDENPENRIDLLCSHFYSTNFSLRWKKKLVWK